jgi:LacI family transcriptional regulator
VRSDGARATIVPLGRSRWTKVSEPCGSATRTVPSMRKLAWLPSGVVSVSSCGLAKGRTEAIGLVFPLERLQLAQTNFVDVLTGISDVVTRRNYSLLLTPFSDNEQEVLRKLATSKIVDGIIITRPLVNDPRIPLLHDLAIPFVVHGRSDVDLPYSYVDIDNAAVFEKLGALLLDYGHERIAVFNSFLRFRYAHARREGYCRALAARGMGTYRSAREAGEHLADILISMVEADGKGEISREIAEVDLILRESVGPRKKAG